MIGCFGLRIVLQDDEDQCGSSGGSRCEGDAAVLEQLAQRATALQGMPEQLVPHAARFDATYWEKKEKECVDRREQNQDEEPS